MASEWDPVPAGSEWDVVPATTPFKGGGSRGIDFYRAGLESFLKGDQEGALAAWRKAPDVLEARRGIERIMQKRTPAIPTNEESKALYRTGLEAFLSGDRDRAGGYWKAAVSADPNNLEAKRGVERLAMAVTPSEPATFSTAEPTPEPFTMEDLAGSFGLDKAYNAVASAFRPGGEPQEAVAAPLPAASPWSVASEWDTADDHVLTPGQVDVGVSRTTLNVPADQAWEPVAIGESAKKAYELASKPADLSREGLKMLTDMIPDPQTQSVAANMLFGVPKTVAEIGSEFAASTLDPASVALMGAGRVAGPMLKSPAAQKIAAKAGELTDKYTPILKKLLTYRFGVDGKFQALDDVRIREIGKAIDRAHELGTTLSDDLTVGQQQRLGQILKGSVSTSEAEAPLRAIASNARGTLDALEAKAKDLDLIPRTALGNYTRRDLAEMRKKKEALETAADRVRAGAFRQKQDILDKAAKIDVVGREGLETKLGGAKDRVERFSQAMDDLKEQLSGDEFRALEEIMAKDQVRSRRSVERLLEKYEKSSAGRQEKVFARLHRLADGLGLNIEKINPEDLSVSNVRGLISKIKGVSGRFPGQTRLARELDTKAADINRKIVDSYTESGKKYVPRLYRIFENPKEYDIPNAALPVIDDMTAAQKGALGELDPALAERVVGFAEAGKGQGPLLTSKTKIQGERFMGRKATTEEYRRALGEIKEPAFPVAAGVAQVGQDVANAEFFKAVAKNSDWVTDTAKAGYRALPADAKRYGALAGKYLKAPLADDLERVFHPMGKAQALYESLLSKWKFGKVVLNPATHVRNLISNSILLDLSGVDLTSQPRLLMRAADEMVTKGKYFQEVKGQTNLLGNEFFGGEIKRFRDALFNTKSESLWDRTAALTARTANAAGDIYQAEEQVFKLAKYIHARESGMGVAEAAKEAEKWLFNYTKVSPAVDFLRRAPLGSPFLTYASKAIPRVLEAGIKDPMRVYKYDLMFKAIEKTSQNHLGISDEDMDAIKRTTRGQGVILPMKDENGDPLSLDVTYMLPWGDIGESGGLFGVSPTFSPGGPVKALLDVGYNKSTFKANKTNTGEIYTSTDNEREKAMKVTDYVLKSFLPSWTPGLPKDGSWFKGGYSFEKLASAVAKRPDYFNRVRNLGLVALDTLAGIKISPVNVGERKTFEAVDKKRLIQQLKLNTGRILRHPGVSEDYKKKIMGELDDKVKEILALED